MILDGLQAEDGMAKSLSTDRSTRDTIAKANRHTLGKSGEI